MDNDAVAIFGIGKVLLFMGDVMVLKEDRVAVENMQGERIT